jgi:uncharacterized protein with HEPN domain
MKDERLYLVHIVEALRRIRDYAAGGSVQFFADAKTQDAIARRFEVVGEAAKRLPEGLKAQASHIPWKDLAGFRDVLIHNYDRIDLQEMWKVIETECRPLLAQVESFLTELGVQVPENPRSGIHEE